MSALPADGPDRAATAPRRRRRWQRDQGTDRVAGSGSEPDHRETALAAVLALVVAGSVLAVGATHPVVVAAVAVVSSAALVLAWRICRRRSLKPPLFVPMVLVVLSGFCVIQLVPLPTALLRGIASGNSDIWSRALLPLGETLSWGRISLDPRATLVEALKYSLYAGVFYASAVLAARKGAWLGVAIVFGSAVTLALITLAHNLIEAQTLFGIYRPRNNFAPTRMSPLLNGNNLAGYLNLGAMCGLGLMLSRQPKVPRWACGVGVATIIGIAIRSASRGGVAALPLGILLLAGIQVFAHRRGRGRRAVGWQSLILVGTAALAGGALALLGGQAWMRNELLSENLSKLRLIAWARPLVGDHAWLGIGRGAFESVFAAYRPSPGPNIVFTHPENFVVQWIAEWGVIVAPVAIVALAWSFWPSRVGVTRSAVIAGAWVGAVILLAQNMVDLGLEIPAVSIALVVVLGSIGGAANDGERRTVRQRWRELPPWGARAFLAGHALLALAVVGWARHDVAADREQVRESFDAFVSRGGSPDGVRARVRGAMLAHPADYYFPLVGAAVAWRTSEGNAMAWMQRTLERAPINGRAHLLLAEILSSRGARGQALFELRLAAEYEPALTEPASVDIARLARDLSDVLVAVPPAPAGAEQIALVAQHLAAKGNHALREACDVEALARDPDLIAPRRRRIDARVAALRGDEASKALCNDREACVREIESDVAQIRVRDSESSAAAIALAQLRLAQRDPDAAEAILAPACKLPRGRADCLMVRAQVASTQQAVERLESILKELATESCSTAVSCAAAYTWIGELRVVRGDWPSAAAAFGRAAKEEPNEARWLRVADVAERAQMHVQAVDALEKVSRRRGGADAALSARIAKNRAAAVGGLLR